MLMPHTTSLSVFLHLFWLKTLLSFKEAATQHYKDWGLHVCHKSPAHISNFFSDSQKGFKEFFILRIYFDQFGCFLWQVPESVVKGFDCGGMQTVKSGWIHHELYSGSIQLV